MLQPGARAQLKGGHYDLHRIGLDHFPLHLNDIVCGDVAQPEILWALECHPDADTGGRQAVGTIRVLETAGRAKHYRKSKDPNF